MKIGDRVRVVGIPANLPHDDKFKTPEVFQRCFGRIFAGADILRFEGLDHPMIGLDVGEVLGKEPYMETIWIEPEYLESVSD